ncbi:MAG: HD domain-containing protein [Clostridia bacterium]|nr:HD domain-containing protein [Clostridia bacterium]
MTKELFEVLAAYMQSAVTESAHDGEHIYRVLDYCLQIAEAEKDVDYDILLAAALLHDIGRNGKQGGHHIIGAEMAREFLPTTTFPAHKIDAVCHVIATHSNSCYGQQETLEAKILYDADKLDSLGVMGIARSMIGVGNYNHPMYVIKDGQIDMREDSPTETFVRYYQRAIRKNYERLFTETARRLAAEQKAVDEAYFRAFCDVVNKHHRRAGEISHILDSN